MAAARQEPGPAERSARELPANLIEFASTMAALAEQATVMYR